MCPPSIEYDQLEKYANAYKSKSYNNIMNITKTVDLLSDKYQIFSKSEKFFLKNI